MSIHTEIESGQIGDFSLDNSRILLFRDRLCVPIDSRLHKEILRVSHYSPSTIHPGETKYKDLKAHFW